MEKKQETPIGYRPSDEVKNFLAQLLGDNPILAKTHVIEIAMRFLISQTPDRIEDIFYNTIRGFTHTNNLEKKSQPMRKLG